MPQLGETVTEGTITRWLKQVGDPVAEDEVIFEVSTDKVDSEVPSATSGYLAEILVPEGETVDVGTRLAVITAEAPAQAVAAPSPQPESTAEPEKADAAPESEPAPQPEAPPEREQEVRPTPVGPRASAALVRSGRC